MTLSQLLELLVFPTLSSCSAASFVNYGHRDLSYQGLSFGHHGYCFLMKS